MDIDGRTRVIVHLAYPSAHLQTPALFNARCRERRINAVLVTSGSVARSLAEQLAPLPESTVVACIGPRTAFDARDAGLTVHAIAETRSSEALVDALVEHVRHLPR